ncbi:signal peptidase I [Vagococcus vulneris]|uniref:Signal peptidase I n=1 Tax=Vagococcus vulneris TaxID=1977869 RepID=A0A430A2P7_9ENTE|nr:signal peptidase I [Vagococcus vulneris]RSU00718.1 signal peptidase I [Vagococcus vulneris]
MEKENKIIDIFWHWVKMTILAFMIVMFIRGFILVPLEITGNSMEPTLQQNDFVVTEQFSKIKRFDIVVFDAPDGSTYVKRVIGLPGDHLVYDNDQLYVNGKKVPEKFLKNVKKRKNEMVYTTDLDTSELLGFKKIPKNRYFVLGDNRRLSKDSRSFGTISSEDIIGKVRFVYYPITHVKIFY